ncbi:hypothetical protein, partial [Sphingobacterium sp. CZ-UAM]|uniref:hypothetical protein n=2 Tax=unclassified Sphingobacterium TaxID=2609468 RepID=UPI001C376DDD
WYCRNRWESRSVPFFTRKPLLETVKGFFRLYTLLFSCFSGGSQQGWMGSSVQSLYSCNRILLDNSLAASVTAAVKPTKP